MNHAKRALWEERHRDARPGDPEPFLPKCLR